MYDEFDIQKPFQVFLLTKGYNERHFARRILDEFQSFTQVAIQIFVSGFESLHAL